MSRYKVFITRAIPQPALDRIRAACEVTMWPEAEVVVPRERLLREVRDVDGLYCLLTDKVNAELLDAAPKLKVVSNMAVGFDNIDVAEVTRRGIPAGNTPGVLTETTADFAFTLLMAAARRVVEGVDYVRAGKWKTWGPMLLLGQDIHGATLGLIGLGRIGAAMARRAQGFAMRVLYYDVIRRADLEQQLGIQYVDLATLLRQSDFVSIHTPLTPETRGLINADALRKMQRTAVLVNTSRGPVVDQKALYDALCEGVIAYAALDVTDPEPMSPDDPLLTLPNVIVVPHIASASVATRTQMALIAADNLLAGLRGERLPYCVNPEVYER